jgi:hypothetical protein
MNRCESPKLLIPKKLGKGPSIYRFRLDNEGFAFENI